MRDRSLVGWRTIPGMSRQHLFRYSQGSEGGVYIYCHAETPNLMSVSGKSTIIRSLEELCLAMGLPKCKMCLKEEERLDKIRRGR